MMLSQVSVHEAKLRVLKDCTIFLEQIVDRRVKIGVSNGRHGWLVLDPHFHNEKHIDIESCEKVSGIEVKEGMNLSLGMIEKGRVLIVLNKHGGENEEGQPQAFWLIQNNWNE